MRILYSVTTGPADATKASLPLHLAVNGSAAIGDEASIFLAGDATALVRSGIIDELHGVGVPPMRELFEKIRQHAIPVFV